MHKARGTNDSDHWKAILYGAGVAAFLVFAGYIVTRSPAELTFQQPGQFSQVPAEMAAAFGNQSAPSNFGGRPAASAANPYASQSF